MTHFETGNLLAAAKSGRVSRHELLVQHASSLDDLAFRVHTGPSPRARKLQSYIADKYYRVHHAHLSEFMPSLIEMYRDKVIYGGLGIKTGDQGNFLLEQYLDHPIESSIAANINAPVSRSSIVEIGNLAVLKPGMGSLLISIVAKSLQQAGFRYMAFTATKEVERLVTRLGCAPVVLAAANPARLSPSNNLWGDYYRACPKVMACNLRETISVANKNHLLAGLFDDYAATTEGISQALKTINGGVNKWCQTQ